MARRAKLGRSSLSLTEGISHMLLWLKVASGVRQGCVCHSLVGFDLASRCW